MAVFRQFGLQAGRYPKGQHTCVAGLCRAARNDWKIDAGKRQT
jgi:hypothetical protein